ncbi:MAG: HAD-IIA family hydrolase [Anaerolineae bacterium]|nr:HAD-IIA family hydrolase [Anaerolineae bacterium]
MPFSFDAIRAVVLDMDGVLWRGGDILPGVPAFFDFAQQQGISYAFATNNSSKTVDNYIDRLTNVGIPVGPEQIITSAVATADYIRQRYPVETPVYIIGQQGIRQALAERGFSEDPARAELIVVGIDFDIGYEKFKIATLRIRAGADFIGTNGDRTFPTPEGLVPGNGSLLALIEAATDQAPIVIGKPETAMFEVALDRLGTTPAQTLMIGDRLGTDILGAQRAGLKTALVLTGITSAEEARTADIQADAVFESLADIQAAWETVVV